MDVSRGRRGRAAKGALLGMVAGALVGLVSYKPTGGWYDSPGIDAAGGGVLGALVGSTVGAFVRDPEVWEPVRSGMQMSLAPTRKGGAVSLKFVF